LFGWFKKRQEKKRLDKEEWKRSIFQHAQTRLMQVKRIMDAEGDIHGARKIRSALLTTVVACNMNLKRSKNED